MDSELYVPITLIASFKRVRAWTTDIDLIIQTLKESSAVTVDESGTRVKPNISFERNTVILRDVPECTEEVRSSIFVLYKYIKNYIYTGNHRVFERHKRAFCSINEKRYWKFMVFYI